MNRIPFRKSDPLNVIYQKSPRMVSNELGVFYKVRGGKLNGPFKSESDAITDLSVFIKVLKIEEQLDPENLQLVSK